MKKTFILLFSLLSLMACQENNSDQSLDTASIFQLNSDWENQDGEFMKLVDLQGKTLVMVMIYTSCKTACPQLTGAMSEIEKSLGKYDPSKIRLVLVSIDPEVDTPAQMKNYLKINEFKGEQWLFLRGSQEATREFANVLSMKYKQISPVDFSHSNIISVISNKGILTYQKEGLTINTTEVVQAIQQQMN